MGCPGGPPIPAAIGPAGTWRVWRAHPPEHRDLRRHHNVRTARIVENEQVEVGHRCCRLHDLGQSDEPAAERRPRDIVGNQQRSHGPARPRACFGPSNIGDRALALIVHRGAATKPRSVVGQPGVLNGDHQRLHSNPGAARRHGAAGRMAVPSPEPGTSSGTASAAS